LTTPFNALSWLQGRRTVSSNELAGRFAHGEDTARRPPRLVGTHGFETKEKDHAPPHP
jgi:hypothetical protein